MAHIFHSLIDTEEARRLASENIAIRKSTEEIDLDNSLGRVLSGDILAPINTPPFNRAIKDGYAVRSDDIGEAGENFPVRLKISGTVDIGHEPRFSVETGTCVKVPTGGVMPEGSDSVVMVEYTREDGDDVLIYRSSVRGENIALAGSDMPRGELIVRDGTRIGAREIAVISALGIPRVRVHGRIRIGIASTGDELMQPGDPAVKGKIYESNGRTIKALLDREVGLFNATFYGTLPDIEDTIRKQIDRMTDENDIVIVSGSTSAGEKDMVYRILGEYDPGTVFHGIKIKPGKPTLLARKGQKIIIGLPGFPVSAMMTFLAIFFPYVLREAGINAEESGVKGILAGKVSLDLGKLNLVPVTLASRNGVMLAFPVHGGSGSISRLLRADGYISLQGEKRTAEEGEQVGITLFENSIRKGKYVLAGEEESSLDLLSGRAGDLIKVIKTGHHPALRSVTGDYSDAAGIVYRGPSILDHGDGEKELEGLESLWSKRVEIGIVFRKDSDETITDMESLVNLEKSFAVPGKSEGSSKVLEYLLDRTGISRETFYAKASEVGNFNSVAFAVSENYFSAGISNPEYARRYDLGFIPVGQYYYHILCKRGRVGELSFIRDCLPPP